MAQSLQRDKLVKDSALPPSMIEQGCEGFPLLHSLPSSSLPSSSLWLQRKENHPRNPCPWVLDTGTLFCSWTEGETGKKKGRVSK